jgi:hypothetical protein
MHLRTITGHPLAGYRHNGSYGERGEMAVDVLIGLLALALIGSLPIWPYSRKWGYPGTVGIGVLLCIVLFLFHLYVL